MALLLIGTLLLPTQSKKGYGGMTAFIVEKILREFPLEPKEKSRSALF